MELLVTENPYIVKSTRFKTVKIVMLEEVYSILTVNEDHLLNFTKAALKYYIGKNMTSFFILQKMAAVYFPHAGLGVESDDSNSGTQEAVYMAMLNAASASRAEALKVIKFLIARALRSHIHDTNSLESFVIVCKDRLHHEMILKALQSIDTLKNVTQLTAVPA